MVFESLLSWDMKKMVDQTLQVSSDVTIGGSYEDAKSLDEFHIETFTVQFDKREKSLKLFHNSHEKFNIFSETFMNLEDNFISIGNLITEEFKKWLKQKN